MADQKNIDRDELVAYLNDYLEVSEIRDFCPNGLQVEGKAEIGRIVTGVSACLELFERAADADAILVHHGLFWEGDPRSLTGVAYQRVASLIRRGMNLLAYHLPLDRHYEVGNNAVAASALGLAEVKPFGEIDGLTIGAKGKLPDPIGVDEILIRCRAIFEQEPLVFAHGPSEIHSVGIVSGAASRSFHQANA